MTDQENQDKHWKDVDQRRHWATFFSSVITENPTEAQVHEARKLADRLNEYLFKKYPN